MTGFREFYLKKELVLSAYHAGLDFMIIGAACMFFNSSGFVGIEIAHSLGWWLLCVGDWVFIVGGFFVSFFGYFFS